MGRRAYSDGIVRRCSRCGEEKPATEEFYASDVKAPDGRQAICKECRKKELQEKRLDPDFVDSERRRSREAYWEDPEAGRAKARETQQRHYYKDIEQSRADAREYQKWYRKEFPERVLSTELKGTYGITLAQYNVILARQGGICAVPGCGSDNGHKRLTVDHDHNCPNGCSGAKSCGECIRGLICSPCNSAMGLLHDNVVVLIGLAEYLLGEPVNVHNN